MIQVSKLIVYITVLHRTFPRQDAFDQPEAFIPERYLKSRHGTKEGFDDAEFRNNFGFGSGRVSRVASGIIKDSAHDQHV